MVDKSERINELELELTNIINELSEMCAFLNSQETVTHLSQSFLQWQGGIIGAILEYREEKRLIKIMNTPLYNEYTYYQLCFHIISKTKEMVGKQQEIQSLVEQDDDWYYGGVNAIVSIVSECIKAWYDHAPDVAKASVTIDGQENVTLIATIEGLTTDEIQKLDLPEEPIAQEEDASDDNSGCFGVIVFFILMGGALSALI